MNKVFLWSVIFCCTNVALGQKASAVPFVSFDSLHSPKKSAVFAAILPGMGHIYNETKRPNHSKSRLWWKLPLIYGGLGATIFLSIDNNTQFNLFKQERINRLDSNYIPQYVQYSDANLQIIQEQFRKWRDLSIIGTLAVYVLQIIDANVEGHLLHFDASDDLSIEIQPTMIKTGLYKKTYAGLYFSMRF